MRRLIWSIRVAIAVRLLAWFTDVWPDENPRVGAATLMLVHEISNAIATRQ
ncbi:MAG: hypothetical protein P4L68_08040 [Methylovirgula sp.]|nr:hypothetical protein [Methylovirgula sp.]